MSDTASGRRPGESGAIPEGSFATGGRGEPPSSSKPTTLIVVDDHELVADSVARVLDGEEDFQVLGVAGTVADGIDIAGKYKPDIAVLDFLLPDGDGIDAAVGIAACSPGTMTVMMTALGDADLLSKAVDAGFSGFVTKDMASFQLIEAVRIVRGGGVYLPSDLLSALAPKLRRGYKGIGSDLTLREKEVLQLLAVGHRIGDIAEELFLSHNTVRNHVQNVLTKLDAHSQLEAVAIAVRERIVKRG